MKILLIDNYDSFVYNIVGLLQECRRDFPELEWDVVRCDEVMLEDAAGCDGIILSPGPGLPSEAGNLMPLIRACAATHPILGICLGCQAIAEVFGAALRRIDPPRHGYSSELTDIDSEDPIVGLYQEGSGRVGRYHSWVIDEESMREGVPLKITSRDEDGNIMSVRHKDLPIFGVQFHPESIITCRGGRLLRNFCMLASVCP